MIDPYEKLAQAIVVQAVKDYKKAVKAIQRNPKRIMAGRNKVECERFFRSGWFNELTGLDGVLILEKLQEELKWK